MTLGTSQEELGIAVQRALPSIRPTKEGWRSADACRSSTPGNRIRDHHPGLQGEPSHSTYEGLQRAFRLAVPPGEPKTTPHSFARGRFTSGACGVPP